MLALQQAVAPAAPSSLLTEIRRVPEGLLLAGVSAPRARWEVEPGLEGMRRIVISLPDTELEASVREPEVEDPLIQRMRFVRYRSENESGVRVRVDLRGYPQVALEPVAEGLLLRVIEPVTTTPVSAPPRVSPGRPAPGVFSLWGNVTVQPVSGSTSTTVSTDVAGAQVIPNLFSLESRILYGESDGTRNLLRYTVVTRGFDLGWGTATAGFGDLLLRFGGVEGVASNIGESLDVRGAALRLVRTKRFVLELFGGRARGAPLLVPVGENLTIDSEFSGDRVYGGFLWGSLWEDRFRLGAGWARTVSATPGADRDNRFVEAGWLPSSAFEVSARAGDASGTRPDGSHLHGYLWGAQARLLTRWLDVDGTYRHQDVGYVAPGGNQEFPGEKGSVLSASAHPTGGLRLFASVSQSDAFPLQTLDEGPLSSKGRFAGASYLWGRSTFTASFSDVSQRSIGESVNPVDSETLGGGVTVGRRFTLGTISVGLGEERTTNRLNSSLDLDEKVATLNLETDLAQIALSGSARYAIAERIATGERLPDYGGDIGLSYGTGATSFNLGAFAGRSPAGTALFSSERVGIRGGVSTVLPGGLSLTATANYVSIRLGQGTHVTSQIYAVNLRKIVSWGGLLPGAPGVWDSGEAVSPVSASGVVAGRIFVDANGNGRFDAGEPVVAGVALQAETVTAVSDADGHYRLVLEPGRHAVRVLATTIPFSYQLGDTEGFSVSLGARRRFEKDVALIGFGNVEGRLAVGEAGRTPEDRQAGAFLRLTLEGQGLRRETLSGEAGEFRFANLPPGSYRLAIEEAAIGEAYALEGPPARELQVVVGKTATVNIALRRLTLRERLERRHEKN